MDPPGVQTPTRAGSAYGVVADLAADLPVLHHEMPVPAADRLFRRDPGLRAVAVRRSASADPVLLSRGRLSAQLSGPYGYGRALHERRTIGDLAPDRSLVLPADLALPLAAQAILGRDVESRYEEVIVRWADGALGLMTVAALFERLADVFQALAMHDSLTGLPNRMHLEQVAGREGSHRAGTTLLYVDLDGFKHVNDVHGHRVGDELLRDFGTRLRACVRPDDVVARLGGDEFAVLLRGVSDRDAELTAERIVSAASEPFPVRGHRVTVGASVGIASHAHGAGFLRPHDVEELLKDADAAMYRAKAGGKGRVWRLDAAARAAHGDRATLAARLSAAVEAGQVTLHYQPKVDLRTGATVGYEALARWSDDALGVVPPSVFVPAAEATGLIVVLGRQLLLRACLAARTWLEDGHGWSVAVNVSPIQLERSDLVEEVIRALTESGLPAAQLQLEITELAAIEDLPTTVRTLRAVRELGVRLALDDFGIGYSSLSLLRELPLDELKIDRSFVQRIDSDRGDSRLVAMAVAAAHEYGLVAVAEGVERAEQLETLRDLGCDLVQGFLLGRPAVDAQPGSAVGRPHLCAVPPGARRSSDDLAGLA